MNDLRLVMRAADLLAEGGFRVWLFGGWAEELRGLRPPAEHADVDLLYPAPDFRRLDEYIAAAPVEEWKGKRRPYKRAFELDGVPVELFLVERDAGGWFTDFEAAPPPLAGERLRPLGVAAGRERRGARGLPRRVPLAARSRGVAGRRPP